ncbi:MAG: hypothetical protein HC936_18620 [Leptolyngbyaceae cyanobacterium SU_3_3]|nr:hypothetical protein [Leptolyngbyaceae cyanobacterium SU_3_3]
MPPLKRRHFLQSAGATLATIGLSQFDFFAAGNSVRSRQCPVCPRNLPYWLASMITLATTS